MQLKYYLESTKRNKVKIFILPLIVCIAQLYSLNIKSTTYSLDMIYVSDDSALEQISSTIKHITSSSIRSSIIKDLTEPTDIKVTKESSMQIKISMDSTDEKNLVQNANKINSFIVNKIAANNDAKIELCENDIKKLITLFTEMSSKSKKIQEPQPDKEINLHPVSCSTLFQNSNKLIYLHTGTLDAATNQNLFKAIIVNLENDIKSIRTLADKPVLLQNYVGRPVSSRQSRSDHIQIILSFLVLLVGTSYIFAFLEEQIYEI